MKIDPLKIIIVDDEHLILESLETLIDWESIGIKVVGTADNGATAIDLAFKTHPDIILSDISMPSFSGLEMLEILRKKQMQVEVIFISAYSSFEYANEAINHGAFGYILKPINEAKLLDTVSRCAMKIRANRPSPHSISAAGDWTERLNKGNSIYYDSIVNKPTQTYHSDSEIKVALLKQLKANELDSIHDTLLDLFRLIAHENGVFDSNTVRLHCFEVIDYLLREFNDYQLQKHFSKSGKELNIKKSLANCTDLDEIFEVTKNLIRNFGNGIKEIQSFGNRRLVSLAIDYIHENYHKNVSLEEVAKHLFISSPCLSKLFSAEMHETFSKYLLSYRIKMAKEQLRDTHCKIYEVATRVGYTDVVHFSKLFKQVTGVTPKQYRDRK